MKKEALKKMVAASWRKESKPNRFRHSLAPLGAPENFGTFCYPLVSFSFILRAIWISEMMKLKGIIPPKSQNFHYQGSIEKVSVLIRVKPPLLQNLALNYRGVFCYFGDLRIIPHPNYVIGVNSAAEGGRKNRVFEQ